MAEVVAGGGSSCRRTGRLGAAAGITSSWGAPTHAASGSERSTGVEWAKASARAPLLENGAGYAKAATSAAANQRATSASSTQPVKRAAGPAKRACSRSEESRGGQERGRTCRSRVYPYH